MKLSVGDVVGRWTLINYKPGKRSPLRAAAWDCQCSCGTARTVASYSLSSGASKSCGCHLAEVTTKRCFKHGMGRAPEAQAWRDIKKRCLNPLNQSYQNYGGRGISMAPEWVDDLPRFLSDVGSKPSQGMTLDRIDNSLGYVPGNVRWATAKVQQRNKRTNRKASAGGLTRTVSEWAEVYGLSRSTAGLRITRASAYGIPLLIALSCATTPGEFKKLQTSYREISELKTSRTKPTKETK